MLTLRIFAEVYAHTVLVDRVHASASSSAAFILAAYTKRGDAFSITIIVTEGSEHARYQCT